MTDLTRNVLLSQVNKGGTAAVLTFNGTFVATIKQTLGTFGAWDAAGRLIMTFPTKVKLKTAFGKVVDGDNFLGNVIKEYHEVLKSCGFFELNKAPHAPSVQQINIASSDIEVLSDTTSPLTQTFNLSTENAETPAPHVIPPNTAHLNAFAL